MGAVRERQCTTGLIAIRQIAECGVCIEGDVRQIDDVPPPEARDRPGKVERMPC